MAMIECSHLTMGYGSQIAVEDLSFSVEEGDYLCIVGPNGSGKSTLLKGLLGPGAAEVWFHLLPWGFPRRSATCPSRPRCSGISPPRSGR